MYNQMTLLRHFVISLNDLNEDRLGDGGVGGGGCIR